MSFPENIHTIIGIDQTGAVNQKGRPRPLFAARVTCGSAVPELVTNARLKRFTENEVLKLLPGATSQGSVLIVVDSVLGLPKSLGVGPSKLIADAADYRFADREYGVEAAFAFFSQYLHDPADRANPPKRMAEKLACANSVFKRFPCQKNIGCGTYRVLKELSQKPKWFRLWPHEKVADARFVIAEGYPSLFWRQLLNSPTRRRSLLETYLDREFPGSAHPKTADDCDATVLAIGALRLLKDGYFQRFRSKRVHKQEGWILGLPPIPALR